MPQFVSSRVLLLSFSQQLSRLRCRITDCGQACTFIFDIVEFEVQTVYTLTTKGAAQYGTLSVAAHQVVLQVRPLCRIASHLYL